MGCVFSHIYLFSAFFFLSQFVVPFLQKKKVNISIILNYAQKQNVHLSRNIFIISKLEKLILYMIGGCIENNKKNIKK